eukprot:scaffold2806_cov178-Amphora_coffeaeformis.AAC.3
MPCRLDSLYGGRPSHVVLPPVESPGWLFFPLLVTMHAFFISVQIGNFKHMFDTAHVGLIAEPFVYNDRIVLPQCFIGHAREFVGIRLFCE